MELLDFRNAYAINTSAKDGVENNTCRTQILATCALTDPSSGDITTFYLGKECIGEHMYRDELGIAQVPTSEVCVIFGERESSLQKKFANHEHDVVQSGPVGVRREGFAGGYAYWTDLRFLLPTVSARQLATVEDIAASVLTGEPMVGHTTLSDSSRWSASLQYPLPYINIHPPDGRFQVDVGPILFPDFDAAEADLVDRMRLAYIMYNQLDAIELAFRTPTAVADDSAATSLHYSEVVKLVATSALFSLRERGPDKPSGNLTT